MTAVSSDHEILSFHEPEGIGARGTLVLIPGRGEQPGVYRRSGQRFANDAYRVHVVGDPTLDAARTKDQIARTIDRAVAPGPVVLIGSDTGSLLAALLVAKQRLTGVDALILAGLPSPETNTPAARSWDEELDARTTCPTHRGRISDALVTPGALYEPIPGDWVECAALSRISQPILGLHGQEDPISPLDGVRDLYASAPAAELVSIAGARHDVLNDQTHRTVAATAVLWLERLRNGSDLAAIAHPEQIETDVV